MSQATIKDLKFYNAKNIAANSAPVRHSVTNEFGGDIAEQRDFCIVDVDGKTECATEVAGRRWGMLPDGGEPFNVLVRWISFTGETLRSELVVL